MIGLVTYWSILLLQPIYHLLQLVILIPCSEENILDTFNDKGITPHLSSSPSSQNVVGGVGVVVEGSGVVGIQVGGVQKPEENVPVLP